MVEYQTKLMSADELAAYLGVTRNAAYTLLHTQGFPAVSIGKLLFAKRDAVDAWLDVQCKGGNTR